MPDKFDVIVIGAGAAGMMCAAQAGQRGRTVLLMDHATKLAEKIRISGGGRCNFTNRRVGPENFLCSNPHFVRSALARYAPADFIALVERYGIAYHERDHGQLFCDDSARDIIEMLRSECEIGAVRWAMPARIDAIHPISGAQARFTIDTGSSSFVCDSLVIATGGLSIPRIGATPFGYRVANQFGIPVVPPRPALVPLTLSPATLSRFQPLAGASLEVEVSCNGGRFREAMLITHRGLSGPAILQISSYWQAQSRHESEWQPISINLLPAVDAISWLQAHASARITLPNLLSERLPRRFAQAWCDLHGWSQPLNQISQTTLKTIGAALADWQITPSGTQGYAKAEVTLGGVDTRALSSRTMQASAHQGLYFVGEVIDVTGHLGGHNFQWAWSSGHAAGQFV
ncbi:MAG TPA: NAD(P)/FAD-dependent oxidoreductase [Rhodocyclaceae bacterium]|nr:NAD(P)/FAD-dependent oxidoreductase [Rhodocyclaceae bacterium]HRQ46909.1 NAD(P)/FAD-dependent oxidoreductase [Rhodocyclaceae bacterium]